MRGRMTDWRKYPEVTAFIAENYRGVLTADLTEMVNGTFGTTFSTEQIKSYLGNRKMRSGLGRSKKGCRRIWKKPLDDFLTENKDLPDEETARLMTERFGRPFTASAISDRKCRLGLHSVNDGKFKEGHMPTNGYEKGHRPDTWVPVGTEVDRGGSVYVKAKDIQYARQHENWRPKSHMVWEAVNGPVPEGCLIVFKDGDTRNFDITNLECVTRAENATMNHGGYRFKGESFDTGRLIAQVAMEARRRLKEEKNNE